MRPYLFLLCLLLTALLLGCSKPWINANSGNKKQTAAQFERDSVACEVVSGEQYPLDKRRQLEVYNQCMSDKGWDRRDGEIRFGKQ